MYGKRLLDEEILDDKTVCMAEKAEDDLPD